MAEEGRKGIKMTVEALVNESGLNKICMPAPEKKINGVYVGDLLSRAMSHVESDNLWITIMSNVNVVAVASLTEPAAIILAEGVELGEAEKQKASENGITVLSTPLSAYEICVRIGRGAEDKNL
jgi:hypothetical protein